MRLRQTCSEGYGGREGEREREIDRWMDR